MTTRDTTDETIVYAKIHPAIGIARVGNSKQEDGYYIGPQVTNPPPKEPGAYRDATGALKREVAQFRLYGYNANGDVVRELTMDDNTQIEWRVELANHKAAWYDFEIALDIPEAKTATPSTRRNADITDRGLLSIEPGPRSISTPETQGPDYHFTGGSFMGIEVPLGELRTDKVGRLEAFGGLGQSANYEHKAPTTFANNDGWYDDTSDGPVTASVTLHGRKLEVAPAWVVVAPPNYGPQQKTIRTMYDLMTDVAVQAGQLPAPTRPSFQHDILPIFTALCDLQWMNAGFAAGFGFGMPQHFLDPHYLRQLAHPGNTYKELRRTVVHAFRNPADQEVSMNLWPWIYGDAMDVPMPPLVNAMNALTETQLAMLDCWAEGEFEADFDPDAPPSTPRSIDEVPVAEQPAMLDRAELEFCLADAFHPGCEMTWPVRHATMYSEPFRWRHRDPSNPEPDYGTTLTPSEALSYNGPLYAQFPGSITRWMAIPWQTDTASCRSGYDPKYDPYLPTFWPARVPNQVLSKKNYDTVMNTDLPREQRLEAFNQRADWDRTLGVGYDTQLANMIDHFDDMGIVEVRPGIKDDPDFPPVMQVEDRGGEAMTPEERHLTDHGMRHAAMRQKPDR
ncbi:LodA/GoxA family CTQ-dependent oxidase [Saccharospirillum salsuginis]|uniref:3-isopropylmalate dehydrogenase n=1 Tax=Saccharospirillum salsuginis TaxID=418750 RepID=A0A918KR95_9GAMM|nr:LodA/GoxA family CTQ-dependent oxidase [Saccharospirillum salsuginis]GGX73753.1 3-isopropylmalate dehydrogenase [Saccharospirillum salsuginis]